MKINKRKVYSINGKVINYITTMVNTNWIGLYVDKDGINQYVTVRNESVVDMTEDMADILGIDRNGKELPIKLDVEEKYSYKGKEVKRIGDYTFSYKDIILVTDDNLNIIDININ